MLRLGSDSLRRVGVLLVSLWISACATEARVPPASIESRAELPAGVISAKDAERSQERIAIGKSTKADVVATLGRTSAILTFESGFEVWVYRITPSREAKQGEGELVMLFAPAGTLAKTRLRSPGRV